MGKSARDIIFLGQAATWAIMSGNWNGLDDFRSQMEVLIENLKDPMLAVLTRGALEQFLNRLMEQWRKEPFHPFASKFQSQAPVHKMKENGMGPIVLHWSLTVMIGGSPRLFMICQKGGMCLWNMVESHLHVRQVIPILAL